MLTGARGTFDASSRRVLEIIANQAAATIQLIKDKEQQRQLAVRDGLTGLYNRRAFGELLGAAIANEDRRPSGSLGLVLLDLDHFKKLNDTYGHPAGDAALRSLARLLDQHLRKGDQAARYGGEEFVVILPGSDAERSIGAAERLRLRAREAPLRLRGRAHPALGQPRRRGLAGRRARSRAAARRGRPRALRRQGGRPQPRGRGREPGAVAYFVIPTCFSIQASSKARSRSAS